LNTWKRKALALLSVPLLAVPSAIGVYTYLAPQSGYVGAGLAAAGFEVLYIGVNILIITTPELRRYARNVSLGAVIVAVLMNSLAHYGASVPGAFSGAPFQWLAATLAVIASAPLAGLAYSVSVLLHRLSEASALPFRPIVTAHRTRLARRLWKLRSEARAATQARASEASASAMLAQAVREAKDAQAKASDVLRDFEIGAHEAAQLRAAGAQQKAELTRLRDLLAQREHEGAQLRAELAQRPDESAIDVWAIAQELRSAGVSLRRIGSLIGVSEGTVRNRTVAISHNGHSTSAEVR
jgi:flagellar hook-basal body complex protein FliE